MRISQYYLLAISCAACHAMEKGDPESFRFPEVDRWYDYQREIYIRFATPLTDQDPAVQDYLKRHATMNSAINKGIETYDKDISGIAHDHKKSYEEPMPPSKKYPDKTLLKKSRKVHRCCLRARYTLLDELRTELTQNYNDINATLTSLSQALSFNKDEERYQRLRENDYSGSGARKASTISKRDCGRTEG